MSTAATVSEYIAHTPPEARKALKQIRVAIKLAAPGYVHGLRTAASARVRTSSHAMP